jgi:hypothetical protein
MEALLVIDVQLGMFADPALLPYEGEAVVAVYDQRSVPPLGFRQAAEVKPT